jgi:L-ascorbate metabolism protein UlaG (beta-lactamase superfamily)
VSGATAKAGYARPMRLRKLGHACILLEQGGARLVIDPGSFSAPDALDDAHAVLITHEHVDHVVPDQVSAAAHRTPGLRIWTNPAVADLLAGSGAQVETVADGDRFRVDDTFEVLVRGEWHAVIHPDVPRERNVGYLVDSLVFHPGDALTLPGQAIDTLLLPVSAPWCKIAEVIDYARAVNPRLSVPIHDALLSNTGLGLFDRLLGPHGPGIGAEYRRLGPTDWLDLPSDPG